MMKTKGKFFNKINQMTIFIYGDKCHMTDEYSKYMRFSSIERRINQISGKYPNILKNNFLIKNKSHIIFNIQYLYSNMCNYTIFKLWNIIII